MDRPYGPTDNQYILQGYQPSSAIPLRNDLPIKPCRETSNNTSTNNFGMTTPGTPRWQSERKVWKAPNILVGSNNYKQNILGNKMAKMNVPMTHKDDYINTNYYDPLKIVNMTNAEIAKYNPTKVSKFGNKHEKKFISGPVNQTYPFLTYAAGSTGKNFPEQVPIRSSPKSAYLSKNIKDYVTKNASSQRMLYEGLNSSWSINAQGINNNNNNYGSNGSNGSNDSNGSSKFKLMRPNKLIPSKKYRSIPTVPIKQNIPFGKNNPWIMTRTPSGAGTNPAQYFKRGRFTDNGNSFGRNEKRSEKRNETKNKMGSKMRNVNKKRPMKFTSPLGIEISFD